MIDWARDVGKKNGFVIIVKYSDSVCGVHNHPAEDHLERHSYLGRLSHQENELLVDMSKSMFERTDNYVWALSILRGLMDDNIFPEVIVTDRELALMSVIDVVFLSSKHLLCRCHINKNVLAKCKKMFKSKDTWEKFTSSWNLLIFSSSEDKYHEHLSTLHKEFSAYLDALDYVTQTSLKQYKEKFVESWTNSCMHYGNANNE
ncbi:hypothetical protein ACSBR2_040228 [Camellia fascicularis]